MIPGQRWPTAELGPVWMDPSNKESGDKPQRERQMWWPKPGERDLLVGSHSSLVSVSLSLSLLWFPPHSLTPFFPLFFLLLPRSLPSLFRCSLYSSLSFSLFFFPIYSCSLSPPLILLMSVFLSYPCCCYCSLFLCFAASSCEFILHCYSLSVSS